MPAAATKVSVASSVMPMKPTLTLLTRSIQYGRKRRLAGGRLDDVRREPLEVGAGVWLIGEVAAVYRVTTAVLHTKQFGDPFVEFVIADTGHIELHRVQRPRPMARRGRVRRRPAIHR